MQDHGPAGIYELSRTGIWEDLRDAAEDTIARMHATEIPLSICRATDCPV